jgi:hypothetical protein
MSFNNGGFIEDEAPGRPIDEDAEPAAMESEYYVDGKIKVGAKPKNGKKKSKKTTRITKISTKKYLNEYLVR